MNHATSWTWRPLLAAVLMVLAAGEAPAQPGRRIGAQVYAETCSNQYCHGARGAAGAAPAVAGKGLSLERVSQVIREGIPDTSMAGWKDTLSVEDLAAVIEYVSSLQQTEVSRQEKLDPTRPWLAHPGRELFFDANRITPCGSCHTFDGLGLAVASRFEAMPPDSVEALRKLKSDKVRTIQPATEEPFVGIAAPPKAGVPRWYDLSAELPVLRTFETLPVEGGAASSWSHGSVIRTYSDAELGKVLKFLREALAE